jgi:hypothetical protein
MPCRTTAGPTAACTHTLGEAMGYSSGKNNSSLKTPPACSENPMRDVQGLGPKHRQTAPARLCSLQPTSRTSRAGSPSYGDDAGPMIITLKYRKFSSFGSALMPGAAYAEGSSLFNQWPTTPKQQVIPGSRETLRHRTSTPGSETRRCVSCGHSM